MQGRLVSDFGWKGQTGSLNVCCYLHFFLSSICLSVRLPVCNSFKCPFVLLSVLSVFTPMFVYSFIHLYEQNSYYVYVRLSICLIRTAIFPSACLVSHLLYVKQNVSLFPMLFNLTFRF